jgi:hypothetical protein
MWEHLFKVKYLMFVLKHLRKKGRTSGKIKQENVDNY